jgi:heme iron utilization protein
MASPIRPTDDAARSLARQLLAAARHGALGVIDPATGGPMVTRVAVGWDGAAPLILVSTLSAHTAALQANPATSLLVGDPGPRGDPLNHPRLTLLTAAHPVPKDMHRARWLADHPKTALYFDFSDFMMVRLSIRSAHLNGGFGKAFILSPEDLLTD